LFVPRRALHEGQHPAALTYADDLQEVVAYPLPPAPHAQHSVDREEPEPVSAEVSDGQAPSRSGGEASGSQSAEHSGTSHTVENEAEESNSCEDLEHGESRSSPCSSTLNSHTSDSNDQVSNSHRHPQMLTFECTEF
jgi:hypothetical protein